MSAALVVSTLTLHNAMRNNSASLQDLLQDLNNVKFLIFAVVYCLMIASQYNKLKKEIFCYRGFYLPKLKMCLPYYKVKFHYDDNGKILQIEYKIEMKPKFILSPMWFAKMILQLQINSELKKAKS
jgi:hypothetical protein